MLASQMKSFGYVRRLIDKQRQFSLGCYRRMHTHLMSPALAITSGAANDILRSHEHSCKFLRMFNKTCVCSVFFVVDLSVKHNGLYKKLQSNWTQNYSSQPVCIWVVEGGLLMMCQHVNKALVNTFATRLYMTECLKLLCMRKVVYMVTVLTLRPYAPLILLLRCQSNFLAIRLECA